MALNLVQMFPSTLATALILAYSISDGYFFQAIWALIRHTGLIVFYVSLLKLRNSVNTSSAVAVTPVNLAQSLGCFPCHYC